MRRWCILSALVAGVLSGASQEAQAATPLDTGSWFLAAHMSNVGGMFDGNGNLQAAYSYGTFVGSPAADTADFERPFSSVLAAGARILFITGDLSVWGMTDYATLRGLIDAQGGTILTSNITFETNAGTVNGNVVSRAANPEDPWIGIANGSHLDALTQGLIVWGETDYNSPQHVFLKNAHQGINVFIEDLTNVTAVPEPASTGAALLVGLAGLGMARRRRG